MGVKQCPGMPGAAERGINENRSGRVQGRRQERDNPLEEDRPVAGSRCAHRNPLFAIPARHHQRRWWWLVPLWVPGQVSIRATCGRCAGRLAPGK